MVAILFTGAAISVVNSIIVVFYMFANCKVNEITHRTLWKAICNLAIEPRFYFHFEPSDTNSSTEE
jgi:hypothetical protein